MQTFLLPKPLNPVRRAGRCNARFPTKPRRKYTRRPIYPDEPLMQQLIQNYYCQFFFCFRFYEAEPSVCLPFHNAASRIQNTPAPCNFVTRLYHNAVFFTSVYNYITILPFYSMPKIKDFDNYLHYRHAIRLVPFVDCPVDKA